MVVGVQAAPPPRQAGVEGVVDGVEQQVVQPDPEAQLAQQLRHRGGVVLRPRRRGGGDGAPRARGACIGLSGWAFPSL